MVSPLAWLREKRAQQPAPLVQCPGCELELPEDDSWGQIEHMQAQHPEIIEQRRAMAERLQASYD